jgi:fermentation-respiration switch protein FrsA (DUF1100 family)
LVQSVYRCRIGSGSGELSRGFGKSEGSPTEAGLYADARIAIDYAQGTLKMPSKKLIYFGESLGSGVAVQMATERPPGLLMLQTPYTSVETRAAELCPFVIGVRHLVRDKYDSLSKIASVEAPLLICTARKTPSFRCAMAKLFSPRQTNLKPWWSTRRRTIMITAANKY